MSDPSPSHPTEKEVMTDRSPSHPTDKEITMDADFTIDRNPVALIDTVPHKNPLLPKETEKSKEEKMENAMVNIFTEMAESGIVSNNIDEIRNAPSEKSFGCDTESEFEFSGGEDSEFESFKTICEGAKDSDEEFDRLVEFSSRMIEKVHKAEYPEKGGEKTRKTRKPHTKIVHEYDNLPPIENLKIECHSDLIEFGHVKQIVDCMVIIESTTSVVLDFDSYLFDEKSHAIGQIYDIFGQVKTPSYVILFNSHEEASRIPIAMKVFYAPNEEQFSKTPFKGLNIAAANRDEIEKINKKMDDIERRQKSEEHIIDVDSDVEFSDDEQEREFAKQMKGDMGSRRVNRKRDRRGGQQVRFSDNGNQNSRNNPTNNRQVVDNRSQSGNCFYRGRGAFRNQNSGTSSFQSHTAPNRGPTNPNNAYAEFGVYNSSFPRS